MPRLGLARAAAHPRLVGLDRLPGVTNSFIGSDPGHWHRGIPTYVRVAYQDVYPGMDLIYHGVARRLEYDFVVQPGGIVFVQRDTSRASPHESQTGFSRRRSAMVL